jgi:TRAP-type mannitol/chloroaromatic compound transport system permease small subunit
VNVLSFLLSLSKGIDDVTTLVGRVARWLTLFMVLVGVFNVVTRYVGRSIGVSLGGTFYIALQTYAYDLVFLLGAAYIFRKDGHVRVDILYSSLSPRVRAWIDVFGNLVFLIPFAIMGIYFAAPYVASSWRQQEINLSAGGILVYPIKTVIVVAFALLLLQAISELIKHLAYLRGHPHSRSIHARPERDAPPPVAAGGETA